MQQHSLLTTKLYVPPIRSGLVSRPRLLERLNAGLHRKLILISAPAGFGKTTLVSEWVSHFRFSISDFGLSSPEEQPIQNPQSAIQNRVAWPSLDEGDNDPSRFLAYLIAGLRTLALSAEGTSGIEGRVLSGGEGTEARQEPVRSIGKGALDAPGDRYP